MSEIIVIPTEDDSGLNAKISYHFGRAPFFTIVYMDSFGGIMNVKTIPNVPKQSAKTETPADRVLSLKPTCIIVRGMGWKALEKFKASGINVYKTDASTVKEALKLLKNGKLKKLTEACPGRYNL